MCPNHKSYQAVTNRENLHKEPTNARASDVITIKLACGCIFPVDKINRYQKQVKTVIDAAAKRKDEIDQELRQQISELYAGIDRRSGKVSAPAEEEPEAPTAPAKGRKGN